MFIRIEPASSTPIYRQVMEQIRYQIATAALVPGEQLPSVRSLAAQIGVNQNTILKVYNELCREGVFRVERGSGTFVAETGEAGAMTDQQKIMALEPLASQLAVQAHQMALDPVRLHKLLDEKVREISQRANTHGSDEQ